MTMLKNISPVDGRYKEKTEDLSQFFSEFALIKYRHYVEVQWVIELSKHNICPNINDKDEFFLQSLCQDFSQEDAKKVKKIEEKTGHDVKAVEYYLQEQFKQNSRLEILIPYIHFNCTSEDINNCAYSLMIKNAITEITIPTFKKLLKQLAKLSSHHAHHPLLSLTHGQPATPTTIGKEFAIFGHRMHQRFLSLSTHIYQAKFNGAVGNFNAHYFVYPEIDWKAVSKSFLTGIGLTMNPFTTQIDPHDSLCSLFQCLQHTSLIGIDLSTDVWGYISRSLFSLKIPVDQVGSSTMPQKINPIHFENAEGNYKIAISMLDGLISNLPRSRWQRDLSDSTQMRNIGVILAHFQIAQKSLIHGLSQLHLNEDHCFMELNHAWEVLAEPLQLYLKKIGIEGAYEMIKKQTQGKKMDAPLYQSMVKDLNLSEHHQEKLLALSPDKYLGIASELAMQFTKEIEL
jgi:adenylosuccinate lyase